MSMEMGKSNIDKNTGQIEIDFEERSRIAKRYHIQESLLILQDGSWYVSLPDGRFLLPKDYYEEIRREEREDNEREQDLIYRRGDFAFGKNKKRN